MTRVNALRIWVANRIAPKHYTVLPSYVMLWIEAGLFEPTDDRVTMSPTKASQCEHAPHSPSHSSPPSP